MQFLAKKPAKFNKQEGVGAFAPGVRSSTLRGQGGAFWPIVDPHRDCGIIGVVRIYKG